MTVDSTTLYVKVGKRYKPVAEYSPERRDMFNHGYYVVVASPGCTSYTRITEPAVDQVLIAMQIAKDAMAKAMQERVKKFVHTSIDEHVQKKHEKAWAKYLEMMGDDVPNSLYGPSQHDIIDAGMKALHDFDYSTAGLVVKDED
jgi:hypothetical protein